MKTNFNEIVNRWKNGKFDPVYLFAGEEDFLIDVYLKELHPLCLEAGSEDFNLDVFYGSEAEGSAIVNAASSYPVMATRRLVIVKNIENLSAQSLKILGKYVKAPSPTTCLVLTAAKFDARKKQFADIKSNATTIETKPLYDNQIADWLKDFLRKESLTISEEAIRLLHASAGNSLRALASEIDKIKLNLGDRKNIESIDVETVVGISRKFNVFEFCDAVGRRDAKTSLHILQNMLQLGETPVAILNMLTRHFLILSKIKELKYQKISESEIARKTKVHPFFLGSYARQATLYTSRQFEKIFNLLLEADIQLKSSYQKPRLVLETLLFRMGLLSSSDT